MKASDTLTFELSQEQETVLAEVSKLAARPDAHPEGSYRAWNAAFLACDEPLEPSYRAWNAAFVQCDEPLEPSS